MKSTLILLAVMFTVSLSGQIVKDEKAFEVLSSLQSKYNQYKSIEADFELQVEVPEEAVQIEKGKIIQSGSNYVLNAESQKIYCDGSGIWVHLVEQNEVQINDYDEEESDISNLSPSALLKQFNEEDYEYAIVSDEKGIMKIELKPTDRDSDFAKVRLSIHSKNNSLVQTKVFYKDGIRYTIDIQNVIPNKTYANQIFSFDKTKYPSIHIEDLRID